MPFRFYSNMLSQASRTLAASVLVVGLLLIGFGMLIMALPALFAFLAAAVFFLAGIACAITAIKIFIALRRFEKHMSHDADAYRENVVIHRDEFHDL
jgi:membrane protein implicated in regulation of membrane protease activity